MRACTLPLPLPLGFWVVMALCAPLRPAHAATRSRTTAGRTSTCFQRPDVVTFLSKPAGQRAPAECTVSLGLPSSRPGMSPGLLISGILPLQMGEQEAGTGVGSSSSVPSSTSSSVTSTPASAMLKIQALCMRCVPGWAEVPGLGGSFADGGFRCAWSVRVYPACEAPAKWMST